MLARAASGSPSARGAGAGSLERVGPSCRKGQGGDGSRRRDAASVSDVGGRQPVRDAELAVEVAEVELDGLLGDPELAADRLVGQTAGQGLEHRELALGQAGGAQLILRARLEA